MKWRYLFLSFLLYTGKVAGQLTITPGAQLCLTGNAQLTLQDIDLLNNGDFIAGNSFVSFTGNASSFIRGSQPIHFYDLAIGKTEDHSALLQRPVSVGHSLSFSAGYLDLNGFDADLGSTGMLENETAVGRVIGNNGGEIIFRTTLNAPVNANPANLGAIITSGRDLGNVVIRRGHRSQTNSNGTGNSILRYYDIVPDNNASLNATVRFNYFEGELNGSPEDQLIFWKSEDHLHWINDGFTTRNAQLNYVEKTGISSFQRITLSAINNVLPVEFILFNAVCESNVVVLTWKTAQEQNTSHFNIERSIDGTQWTVIGSITAAGNSTTERTYRFRDNSALQNYYYRIASYDIDGVVHYTGILQSSCAVENIFKVWPSPFTDRLVINLSAGSNTAVIIKLFDTKGALVKQQATTVSRGNNMLQLDTKGIMSGAYLLVVEWGGVRKVVRVLKVER